MKKTLRKEIRIFLLALAFRGAVYALSVCVMAIMGDYPDGIHFTDFLEAWKRWDSAHYINIAENGYMGAMENGEHIFLVFYPLYPWLMRALALFLPDYRLCGTVISLICFGVGCVYFYRITEREFGERAAQNGLILISVFPFGFFFGSIATESLFFALTAAFFYYLGRQEWAKTAILGFLACLCKVQGLLLAFAVLVEIFHSRRGIRLLLTGKWKDFGRKVLLPGCLCALMLLGFGLYLLINWHVEGDPFRFMYYQKNHWHNGLCPIWQTFSYVKGYALESWHTSLGMSMWVPELVLFFVWLIMIGYGLYRRLRPAYLTYMAVFFLLTYSSTWLMSAGRYTLNALPVFMLAGDGIARHDKIRTPVIVFSSMLMMIYMIAYYSWKQVM